MTEFSPADTAAKIAQIATLPADQLQGWFNLLTGVYHTSRNPLPGELAAIYARAERLGVKLEGRS